MGLKYRLSTSISSSVDSRLSIAFWLNCGIGVVVVASVAVEDILLISPAFVICTGLAPWMEFQRIDSGTNVEVPVRPPYSRIYDKLSLFVSSGISLA